MTPEQFANDLSDRLRRKGVGFRPKDVEAFAAKAWTQGALSLDLDAWAERFLADQAQGGFTRPLTRERWLPRIIRVGIGVVFGSVCGAIVATAAFGALGYQMSLSHPELWGLLAIVMMWLPGTVFGVILGAILEAMRMRHSWLIGGCLGGLIVGGLIVGLLPLLDFVLAPL